VEAAAPRERSIHRGDAAAADHEEAAAPASDERPATSAGASVDSSALCCSPSIVVGDPRLGRRSGPRLVTPGPAMEHEIGSAYRERLSLPRASSSLASPTSSRCSTPGRRHPLDLEGPSIAPGSMEDRISEDSMAGAAGRGPSRGLVPRLVIDLLERAPPTACSSVWPARRAARRGAPWSAPASFAEPLALAPPGPASATSARNPASGRSTIRSDPPPDQNRALVIQVTAAALEPLHLLHLYRDIAFSVRPAPALRDHVRGAIAIAGRALALPVGLSWPGQRPVHHAVAARAAHRPRACGDRAGPAGSPPRTRSLPSSTPSRRQNHG